MKRMGWIVVLTLLATVTLPAEEKNGLRVTVQKTVLERDKDHDPYYRWDEVNKVLGLNVALKNVSMNDMGEGEIEYVILVKRWGYNPARIERYKGAEKLPALTKSEETKLKLGRAAIGGYEGNLNRKRYQDNIEGWQVVVKHNGTETIRLSAPGAFEELDKKASDAPKQP
jgi:hypothetical protein